MLAPDRDASEDTVVANLDDTPTVIDARRLLDDDPNAWTLVSPHPGPGRGHTEPQARNTPSVDIRTPVSPGNPDNPGNPNDPRSSRTDSLASNVRSRRANRRSGSAALTRIALPQGVAPTREVVEPDDAVVRYAARHIAATPTGPTLTFAELPPEAHRAPATAIPSVARRGRRFGRLALTAFGAACIVSVVGIILLIVTLTA